jgi:hypothetical protein
MEGSASGNQYMCIDMWCMLAGAVASLRGHGAKEASAILFWEHILAVLSLTGWLMLYINVLF